MAVCEVAVERLGRPREMVIPYSPQVQGRADPTLACLLSSLDGLRAHAVKATHR